MARMLQSGIVRYDKEERKMPNAEATVPMTLRLPVDLRQAIEQEAEKRDIALNDLCKEALWEHVRSYKEQHGRA